MAAGTVKWFSEQKGYGFIAPDEEGVKDIFVHYSAINATGFKTLSEGDRVEYEIMDTPRGTQAVNVSLA